MPKNAKVGEAGSSIEKIKTVGDTYMVAGGVPAPCPNCRLEVTHLAFQLMKIYLLESQHQKLMFEGLDGIQVWMFACCDAGCVDTN